MSNRLRYYKSTGVRFIPIAIMKNDKDYVNLITEGFSLSFETIKDAVKSLSVSESIKQVFNTFDGDAYLVLSMIKETPEVDAMQLLGDGDPNNILHYCKSSTIFLKRNFKPYMVSFNFANMPEESDFKSAAYFAEDQSVRFGSGAMDAYQYFSEECQNKELSEYITKDHMNFKVLW